MTRGQWGLVVLAILAGLAIADSWAYLDGGYPATLSAAIAAAGQAGPLLAPLSAFSAGVLYGHWFFTPPASPPAPPRG